MPVVMAPFARWQRATGFLAQSLRMTPDARSPAGRAQRKRHAGESFERQCDAPQVTHLALNQEALLEQGQRVRKVAFGARDLP